MISLRPWPLVALFAFLMLSSASAGSSGADPDYVPVAKRPRSEVLAKGQEHLTPDLTRGTVNDYRDLLAWILGIKFSDEQCDQYEQRMITRWPSFYSMDTDEITGASKLNAQIRAMPPAQLKATHKQLNEQVLKNLRDMVGGASMLGSFKVVTEEDRKDARWLLAIYEDQHPEAVAPMPALPDVPGTEKTTPEKTMPPDQGTKPEPPQNNVEKADATLAPGATPLKQSSVDAMSQILFFLSAKSQKAQYLSPGDEFRSLFARNLAAEYGTYSAHQQSAFAKLPEYWRQLSGSWDRMSQRDRDTTLATWKPLLDALQTSGATPGNLSADDQAALARMTDESARTREQLAQMRSQKQLDLQQQIQMQQLERMQQMQQQQITMMSNIARSAHETNMRIIDNMGPTRHPWDR